MPAPVLNVPQPVVVAAPAPMQAAPPPRHGPGRLAQFPLGLRSHLTGLNQVIWLQRADGRDQIIIEVSPGGRYDTDTLTVLALEPIVVQVSGGLYARDLDRVSAWAMANRDLIDDVWDGVLTDAEEIFERTRKVPAPGWR